MVEIVLVERFPLENDPRTGTLCKNIYIVLKILTQNY